MEVRDLSIAAVVAAVAAAASTPLAISILRRWNAFDPPSARSTHRSPTLRGAGVSVVLGAAIGTCAGFVSNTTLLVIAVAVPIAIVGSYEDLHGTSVRRRLLAQLVVAIGF